MDAFYLALVMSLSGLSALVLSLRNRSLELEESLKNLRRDHYGQGSFDEDPINVSQPRPWDEGAPFQPGTPFDRYFENGELADHSDCDRWRVVILVDSPQEGETLIDGIEGGFRKELEQRYCVQVLSRATSSLLIPTAGTWPLAVLPDSLADACPTPGVLMLNPDGTIVGAGVVDDGESVLGFVFEGEHQGYGPTGAPFSGESAQVEPESAPC